MISNSDKAQYRVTYLCQFAFISTFNRTYTISNPTRNFSGNMIVLSRKNAIYPLI